MDKLFKPDSVFDKEPSSQNADKAFIHWKFIFEKYKSHIKLPEGETLDALSLLVSNISAEIYSYISDKATYEEAMAALESMYVKPKNAIFGRFCLKERKQTSSESLDDYLRQLRLLVKDCDYKDVNVKTYEDESIRDAFIAGIKSNNIRQRLLEESGTLDAIFKKAQTLEQAYTNNERFQSSLDSNINAAVGIESAKINAAIGVDHPDSVSPAVLATMRSNANRDRDRKRRSCYYCGYEMHPRPQCPARDKECDFCKKKGHFASVCKAKHGSNSNYTSNSKAAATTSSSDYGSSGASYVSALSTYVPQNLEESVVSAKVNDFLVKALVDTGSTESFASASLVKHLNLEINPSTKSICMASGNHVSPTLGYCSVDLSFNGHMHNDTTLLVLNNLVADVIIGHDIMRKHSGINITFPGHRSPICIDSGESHGQSNGTHQSTCSLAAAALDPPPLFRNLSSDCKPIACKSRTFSQPEQQFISTEISRMLKDDIIEPSHSAWRAQVLVTTEDRHKRRLVVDYSRTVNKFTQLDAYPLPNLDALARKVAKFKVYSAYDLQSAYHQIPILKSEREFTAFEAGNRLYQFRRIPFGVTNGVAAFQRAIDQIIDKHKLDGTFAYLDNITVCGVDQADHDRNIEKWLEVVDLYNLTLNHNKSILSVDKINMLGYLISQDNIKPDPERMKPLIDLPVPKSPQALKRALGLFSYYSPWIEHFSDKIQPLTKAKTDFPLTVESVQAFNDLKRCIINSSICCPNDSDLLVVESDASDLALSASLNQNGKPVAFFSRTLQQHERHHSSVEKEACAIVEACRKFRHFLAGRKFLLITDQQAVSFMFNSQGHGKIKNDKIHRWRIELSCFDFDIKYRPGKMNFTADCLTRAHCAATSTALNTLAEIHNSLCHPGIVRLSHYIRSKNLPYSVDDVKSVISKCRICAELKPAFYKPANPPLIQSTRPFERLSIDFKGPLPSKGANKYILTVIDEYSRFPFAFPCKDTESKTVVQCLTQLFSVFGLAGFIHSDRGPALISAEVKGFLTSLGVGSSNMKYYPL